MTQRAAVTAALATTARELERLDAAIERVGGAHLIDPAGHLRTAVRALLPVAVRTPGFDVTLATTAGHAVRVRSDHGRPTAQLTSAVDHGAATREPERGEWPPAGVPEPVGLQGPPAGSAVVAELADLLRGTPEPR